MASYGYNDAARDVCQTLKLGAEIDAHEMVYRFNQAPTAGFVARVGRRTDFESLNAHHAQVISREAPRNASEGGGAGRRSAGS
jgi:hypothetical protein